VDVGRCGGAVCGEVRCVVAVSASSPNPSCGTSSPRAAANGSSASPASLRRPRLCRRRALSLASAFRSRRPSTSATLSRSLNSAKLCRGPGRRA